MPARKSYHHGDLRQALIEAATEVLRERGVAGFTLRECARRAGVSHAAPAHHFGDVTGLLSAVAAEGFRQLSAVLDDADAGATDDLDERFSATIRSYVDFARSRPELFRVMFRRDLLDEASDELHAAAAATFARLTSVIRSQRGEDDIDEDGLVAVGSETDLQDDIMIGWCHIHGLAHLLIEGQLQPMVGEDEEAFLARTLTRNGPALAHLIRQRAAD